MRTAPHPAPAGLLSRCSSPLASAPRPLLLSCPSAPAVAAVCRAGPPPGVARSVSVSVEAPATTAEAVSPATAPRRCLILLRHGESAAGVRSTRGVFLASWRVRLYIYHCLCYQVKNTRWRPAFALETGGSPNSDGQDFEEDNGFLGRTRLGRLIQAATRRLLIKLNSGRVNSPTKIFLLLLGFYTANALATILGQTGDWDVLVAGVVVAAIEVIGKLLYRKPVAKPPGRFQSLIAMLNYWKAGVCLGLFVDAFKVGS